MHEALTEALSAFTDGGSTRDRAASLFDALGYHSARTVDIGCLDEFVALLGNTKPLTERQRGLFNSWNSAEIVFQITEEEIHGHPELFQEFDKGCVKSFLFVAANLEERAYSRTELAEMTRAVNRGFPMPVIVLFRHGATLTLAAVHRRAHKRDSGRDVLERVTLIKDIRSAQPHRAHVDILADLSLPRLIDAGVRDFDDLHAEWERVLDIEELNRRFYRELFDWFQRAVGDCCFPDDGAGEGSTERHVIRLITRLLFIWFMREKGLIPGELFQEGFARTTLKKYASNRTDYYRAVMQNLFFATLNTEVHKRAFSRQSNATHRDFTKYRYRGLLTDPDSFVEDLKRVPFVNGGLFDCLDDFAASGAGGRRIDAFTDNIATQGQNLDVPARLLLDQQDGLFPLFRRYKFTVEENTPLDREVALDPELLGRVFENLLAAYNPETREPARKATGSYYTPRQVVDYMVREALAETLAAKSDPADGDVKFWRERIDYLLDHSDAMDDADELFVDAERNALVSAIADIKMLDPAVGSGAFPMGILQKLTLALRRIDPDNALWEGLQKERAKTRAGAAFDTADQRRRDDALREISDTFERYRNSDFGRKLYLIQNSIYGVDIQPIACQIAKLRFFISLSIEQDLDSDAPNLGIKPLPNLETRFVAADTLIGLQEESVSLLLEDTVRSKRKEVATVRERYFLADNRPKKLSCIDAEKRLRRELREILDNERKKWIADQRRDIDRSAAQFPRAEDRKIFKESKLLELELRQREYDDALANARKVAEWDPYDQNAHAGWFSPEYMFDVSGGFDVVIGNPPYIQLQKNGGRARKKYQGAGYKTFAPRGDIYQLFYECGCRLLKPCTGTLAYITSNSWLKAEYGRPLRRWFSECHTPLRLIEMGKDVFAAIVDTSVLLVREGGDVDRVPAVDMDRQDGGVFPPPESQWGEARPDGEAPWSILSGAEWRVLGKMREAGVPLKDWDVRINYGIKTGYNAAFIIDDATRDSLIAEDSRSDEIIKPVLRGRDIRRYRARCAGKWLIATLPSLNIDIDDYPAVKAHLLSFGRERLEQSGKTIEDDKKARKKTSHTWFELQDSIGYHEDFAKEKLFWMDMAPEARFAYFEDVMFCNDKAFILTGSYLKYLCAILNSSAITWMVTNVALTTGEGLPQWKKFTIENIPIPRVALETQVPFVRLVDEIISAKDSAPFADTTAKEEEIDRLVFELYGLTAAEIATVKG